MDAAAAATDALHLPITTAEVSAALSRLRRNKAAGIDGLRAEFLLDADEALAPALATTYTALFTGHLPPALNCQLVHPIYKQKGDPLDPSNYRCLSVGPTLTKLYAMILESRLATWAEACGKRAPSQAGFRKDHRTTDHIFTLHTLICQANARRRPLYSCFVDSRNSLPTAMPFA